MKHPFKASLFALAIILCLVNTITAKQLYHKFSIHFFQVSDKEAVKQTVQKFFEALFNNNFKEARKYAVKDKDADNFFIMMEQMSKDPNAKKGNIPTMKDVTVDGSKATVTFVGQPNMKLEKEDGAWKVDVRMKKPPMPKE